MNTQSDRWVLARHRLRDDAAVVAVLWTGFLVFALTVVFLVAAVRTIEVSGWEIMSQLPQWFAGGMGVYATAVYLPLYVTHGYTRREVFRQLLPVHAAMAVLLSALMALGFAIERVVYGLAGWPQALGQEHLYRRADDYGWMFGEFLVVFSVWMVAGALGGAAFYRRPLGGVLVVPVLAVMIGVAEGLTNPGFLPGVSGALGLGGVGDATTALAAFTVCAVCVGAGLMLTWLLARDLPLRPQNT